MTARPSGESPVADSTAADVDQACRRAAESVPLLSALRARSDVLRALAAALLAGAEEAIALAVWETGLSESRLRGEVARTVYQLTAFADAALDGVLSEVIINTRDESAAPAPRPDLRRLLVPLGPVAVFSASNFPFAFSVLGADTASALAAGCPVVVKAHPGHPHLSRVVETIAEQALECPAVQVVYGTQAGEELVRHPAVRAVGFTGSAAGAKALQDVAAARPDAIPFYGELGSVNPVVITSSAMAHNGASIIGGLVGSYTQSAGQYCTKPGLVFIPSGSDAADQLATELASVARSPMLTPHIHERFTAGVTALATLDGVEAVFGPESEPALDVAPVAVRSRVVELPDAALDEHFGPVTVLVEYDNLDEVVAALGRLDGSLTTTVHMTPDDTEWVGDLIGTCTELSGRVVFGGWPTGVAVAPAMQHGGPWPATTNSLHTSVGLTAARRFLRPVCFQDAPDVLLPPELRDGNPLGIIRRIDGAECRDAVPPASER